MLEATTANMIEACSRYHTLNPIPHLPQMFRVPLMYVVRCSWFRLDLSHPPVKLPQSLGAGGQHAVCSVSRMPELKCRGGCSDRETSELDSKIRWFPTDLPKYGTARLEPWRRSATILSREAVTSRSP